MFIIDGSPDQFVVQGLIGIEGDKGWYVSFDALKLVHPIGDANLVHVRAGAAKVVPTGPDGFSPGH